MLCRKTRLYIEGLLDAKRQLLEVEDIDDLNPQIAIDAARIPNTITEKIGKKIFQFEIRKQFEKLETLSLQMIFDDDAGIPVGSHEEIIRTTIRLLCSRGILSDYRNIPASQKARQRKQFANQLKKLLRYIDSYCPAITKTLETQSAEIELKNAIGKRLAIEDPYFFEIEGETIKPPVGIRRHIHLYLISGIYRVLVENSVVPSPLIDERVAQYVAFLLNDKLEVDASHAIGERPTS